jgi:GNAT superfamily N-acetyltransferase
MNANSTLDLQKIHIRPLTGSCGIEKFRCGEREIDQWVARKAKQLHLENKTRIFCARQVGNGTILGFFDLSFSSRAVPNLHQKDESFYRGGVPLVYINYLAVLRSYQGQKLGTMLLINALQKAHSVALNVAFYGVALKSLNERTTALYMRHGFAPRGEAVHAFMILPVWDLYDLFGELSAEDMAAVPFSQVGGEGK